MPRKPHLVITNESNPNTLKLVIAASLSNTLLDVKLVNPNVLSSYELSYLPCIRIEEQNLFFPNAALCYMIVTVDEISDKVNEWLEWESTILSPTLAHVLGSSCKNDKLKQSLVDHLKTLNKILESRSFIVELSTNETSVSVADISIWAVLYPLFSNNSLKKEYGGNCPHLEQWVEKLKTRPEFQQALQSYNIDLDSAYTALLTGAKYLSPAASPESPNPSSPSHQHDAVTTEELTLAEEAWKKRSSQRYLKPVEKLVLPVPNEKNILITSALPYVNNVPHLGNIIGCVLSSDVFARFCRLCNYNTLFICGTDEYGTATETKALEEGLSCQAICDKYYKIHSEIYKWFNISFNHFGRTSTPQQTQLCQSMFLQLNQNGFTFTQSVDQLHCEKCDRYLADRFVEGGCPNIGCNYEDARGDQCDGCGKLVNAVELKNPRCKICKNTPKLKTSHQFFIDLPKLEPLLLHWMKKSAPGWSHNAQVIGKSWLREGLKPRCITRDLKWGVPVPLEGYRDKVFYVWYDAPLGYMSITKNYTEEWEKWWRPAENTNVTLYQFMAKDNVPFHAVMFPATILGVNKGYITVSHIMATEYLNYEDGKFSKSRGVGVFGNDAQDTGIPSDVFRFYLLYVRPESQDSSFSWIDLATKNNSELLNNLGNFINRALVFIKNSFNKTVPEILPTQDDYTLLALCTRELKGYIASLEKAKLRDGIRHILAISRHGNQYMQANQPWVLLKGSAEEKQRAGTVVGICCNIACLQAILLHPYMPETSERLKQQLNCELSSIDPCNPEIVCLLQPGHKIGDPSPLFSKIELAQVEELKKKFAGKQNENGISTGEDVQVIEAEVAKQADKVRVLKSSGVPKPVWQPEVDILLSLKKKLEAALKLSKNKQNGEPLVNGRVTSSGDLKSLEDKVAEQAQVVRKLKESGAAKAVWQPEVEKLLAFKSELAAATGAPINNIQKSKKGKK